MAQQREKDRKQLRDLIAPAPTGWKRFYWYGPGLLWLVSSVGSGSILFTPRVGSRYGYLLVWAALIVALLTWAIIREMGRYSLVSGKTLLDGYMSAPGPRGWAVWLIFLPGIVSGVVVVAGIASLVGSALMIVLPGSHAFYSIGIIIISCLLVTSGRYKGLEQFTSVLAAILVITVFVTAVRVFPGFNAYAAGVIPRIPPDFDAYFIVPWVGFLLAGAAGLMWFSYWVAARGYGGEITGEWAAETEQKVTGKRRELWLKSWIRTMSTTAAIGVVGATITNFSFLTLGVELLGPQGIIPEGIRVAEDLARLLSDIWGAGGRWLLVAGIFVALWGSILANQDGWSRMYADATLMLLFRDPGTDEKRRSLRQRASEWVRRSAAIRRQLKAAYVVSVLTVAPIVVFLILREPVGILSVAGIITSAHTPVVVILTLVTNRRLLPAEFRPGWMSVLLMIAASVFYGGFFLFYFYDVLFRAA